VFLAMLNQESHFNPTAKSYAGALGIAQIMPFHDVNPNKPGHQLAGRDPLVDLRWSANHLAQNLRKYGDIRKALSVYNSGRPDKYLDPGFAQGQTYNYVRNIMGMLPQFRAGAGARSVQPSAARPAARGVVQTPAPLPPDDSSLRRQALMSTISAQQDAYLSGEDYSGPSALQALSALRASQPQPQTLPIAPVASPQRTATPRAIPVGRDGKPLKGAALMATMIAEAKRRGLRVSENAAIDHVDPVHTKGSDHYRLLADKKHSAGLDVGGSAKQLTDYFNWASRFAGRGLKDLFFDPMRYSFDEGKRWNKTIGGHGTHVHASVF
jgi:hypothetical protein